jgi:hypothetical protein
VIPSPFKATSLPMNCTVKITEQNTHNDLNLEKKKRIVYKNFMTGILAACGRKEWYLSPILIYINRKNWLDVSARDTYLIQFNIHVLRG